MYHRFNQFVGALRNSSQFEALIPNGLKSLTKTKTSPNLNVVETTYTPIIKDVNDLRKGVDKSDANPYGWKSWTDIPDSMIPTTSRRDPNNKIYSTKTYINLRKQQIWFQINDGTPVWLKGGTADYVLYYGAIVSVVLLLTTSFYYLYLMIFAPQKKK